MPEIGEVVFIEMLCRGGSRPAPYMVILQEFPKGSLKIIKIIPFGRNICHIYRIKQ